MKILKIITAIGFLGLASASQNLMASDSVSQKCMVCHQGGMSLSGQNADELAGKIKGLLSNTGNHPPMQIEDTSDAAIEALVKALLTK